MQPICSRWRLFPARCYIGSGFGRAEQPADLDDPSRHVGKDSADECLQFGDRGGIEGATLMDRYGKHLVVGFPVFDLLEESEGHAIDGVRSRNKRFRQDKAVDGVAVAADGPDHEPVRIRVRERDGGRAQEGQRVLVVEILDRRTGLVFDEDFAI